MRVSGPLASWETPYRSWLVAQGFTPGTIADVMFHLEGLSRWLERERLAVGELTPERVEQFELERVAVGYSRRWARCTRLPLRFLREVGAVPEIPAPVVADEPVERVLVDYRRYLECERGLVGGTIGRYLRVARLFLEDCVASGVAFEDLTAGHVSGFLARECPKRNVPAARNLACGLRPLLRFLHVSGVIAAPLRWAVPPVAQVRDRSLPRGLDPATVEKLLASCDRRRTVGQRDYAMLLLMVRLGLRAGEVAALELDDLDWRAGEILVRGKGNREDRLPLPADVGTALVSYLRERPRTDSRVVFIRMLEAGASLPEIAQVLRHRALRTTTVYAKVDRRALRPLALPWPGARR